MKFPTLLIGLASLFLSPALVAADYELFLAPKNPAKNNGGFESATFAPWVPNGQNPPVIYGSIVNPQGNPNPESPGEELGTYTDQPTPEHSARFPGPDKGHLTQILSDHSTAGTDYEFGFWIKNDPTFDRTANYNEVQAEFDHVVYLDARNFNYPDWTFFEFEDITVGSATADLRIRFHGRGFLLDDVLAERGSVV